MSEMPVECIVQHRTIGRAIEGWFAGTIPVILSRTPSETSVEGIEMGTRGEMAIDATMPGTYGLLDGHSGTQPLVIGGE